MDGRDSRNFRPRSHSEHRTRVCQAENTGRFTHRSPAGRERRVMASAIQSDLKTLYGAGALALTKMHAVGYKQDTIKDRAIWVPHCAAA